MNDLICRILPADFEKIHTKMQGATAIPLSEVHLCAPIPMPRQDVICLGINYAAHQVESNRFHQSAFQADREKAVYFSKRVQYATATGEAIPLDRALVDSLDYEAELALIIGQDCRNATMENADDFIFGYTILNDVSARNLQTAHRQWYFGKSLDGFTPMGPCIVTADAFAFPPKLSISSRVNGELRQNSSTDQFIHGIDEVICELSRGMTLRTGTIISTGTPAGVGMGFTPPRFLQVGDEVVCEVEGIGRLANHIEAI